jgi:hypothetical protein
MMFVHPHTVKSNDENFGMAERKDAMNHMHKRQLLHTLGGQDAVEAYKKS